MLINLIFIPLCVISLFSCQPFGFLLYPLCSKNFTIVSANTKFHVLFFSWNGLFLINDLLLCFPFPPSLSYYIYSHHSKIWNLFILSFCLKAFMINSLHSWFGYSQVFKTSLVAPAMQETQAQSLGREDPLEKEIATHSSILSWEILWIEKPGGLQVHGVTKNWTEFSDCVIRSWSGQFSDSPALTWNKEIPFLLYSWTPMYHYI